MGRKHRSSSGGSFCELKSPDDSAAKQLFDVLLNLVDASSGKSFLHTLSSPLYVNLCHALLTRANVVSSSITQQLLTQRDEESGYTPLHWACMNANLSAILLLLRRTDARLTSRPMELLEEFHVKDKEGLTPLQLLGMLQQSALQTCRDELKTPRHIQSRRDSGLPSVVEDEEQDELALLTQNLHLLQEQDAPTTTRSNTSTACEVLTFGRSHHVALGVPCSDATHAQRVPQFGLDVCRHDSAIKVAAATHHTLVVTSQGSLYCCGLGKGGRLGTGNELACPLFTRVPMSKRHKVVSVAAAENHSLIVTSNGQVHAFGSNRFGQLGVVGVDRCFSPKRVDDLRMVHVTHVAAGDKHSMALTNQGQVYTWGDNQAGQLGTRQSSLTGKVQLVESLWNASPQKVVMDIAAAEHSSLVLTKPSAMGLPVNAVYQWGHGNHVPIKVNFSNGEQRAVNPVDIACAKYHNAAVSQDGHVYTWGLHAEPLGNTNQQSSMVIASPQLVEGMLPHNGGGHAVAVSAGEHHTAVVTDCGHLFTWGATFGKNVLGHEGVRWQPSPKRVSGIHRAVAVAAAKEHNVVLMGTNFPSMPVVPIDSLETLAARQVSKHVDLFNVIPILITAERAECIFLKEYCNDFIRLNLDGVLTLGRKSEMDLYLNEQLAAGFNELDPDTECHPLVYDVVKAGTTSSVKEFDSIAWLDGCKSLLERLPVSTLLKYKQSATSDTSGSMVSRRVLRRSRTSSIHEDDEFSEAKPGECSERCLMLTANLSVKTSDAAQAKVDGLSKEVRSVRKLLNQIAKLQLAESLSPEQQQKVQRKLLLETDLAILQPALVKVEAKLQKLRLEEKIEEVEDIGEEESVTVVETPCDKVENDKKFDIPENDSVEAAVQAFRCDLCSISCSDAKNLALHNNGRKHRNRVAQAEEEEQKQVAAAILEDKRRQMLFSDGNDRKAPASLSSSEKKSPWDKPELTVQPRYRLPPPPHFPSLGETIASKPPPRTNSSWKKSAMRTPETKKRTKALSVSSTRLSPGMIPSLASPPWALPTARTPAPAANVADGFSSTRSSATPKRDDSRRIHSLGDFIHSPPPPPVEKSVHVTAPWSTSPKTASSKLMDIQQQEQEIRDKEHARVEGKWYIDQRVRAGSISAIQEAEEQKREHELLVEEQRQIEAQIQRERQEQQQQQQNKKRRSRNRKPQKANQKNNDGGGDDKNQPNAAKSGGRKKRPNRRKTNNASSGKQTAKNVVQSN